MHGKLSITVLLRAPVKTAITLVLLIATSFAFISRGAEYATTVHEIDKVEAAYTAVGTLERSTEGYYEYMENLLGEEVYEYENGAYIDRLSNATAPLDAEAVDLVLNSGYVARDEFFMVAGGLTHEYENVLEQPLYDVPNYSEWNWYDMTGTFEMDAAFVITTAAIGRDYAPMNTGSHIDRVLVGNSELFDDTKAFGITPMDSYSDERVSVTDKERCFYGITTAWGIRDRNRGYLPHIDYPAINLTELEEKYGISDPIVALRNPEKYGLVEFKNVYGLPTISTLEYMDTLYRNNHTAELVHATDMAGIAKYHSGELTVDRGRAITADDTGLVCVISADYAKKNGLEVGDTIEFELSADTLMHSGKVWAREPAYPATVGVGKYQNYTEVPVQLASEQELTKHGLDTVTQIYEIVGIWSDPTYEVSDPFSYSPNTVFVPMSTYPWAGEVEPTMLPSTLSFTLNHPGDMAKIEAELGDTLAAMGYELSINDMGYAGAAPSFEFMKLSALISFAAMSLALLLSLALVVYLFILRRRRDYAIMRALGMPERQANNTLLAGLLALSAIAVMLAGLMSLVVTQNFSAELAVQLSEITGVETVTMLPSWLVGVFAAGVLILLTLFARIGLIKVGRTPPLGLLQGGR